MSPSSANDSLWRAYLTGDDPLMRRERERHKRIPGAPRCKTCLAPLGGIGGLIMRLRGRRRSRKNPNFCDACERFADTHRGGAEILLTMLFADVRGSTSLAERMSPSAFSQLMNRFYAVSSGILIKTDGMIDKLVGDEIIGLYLPFLGAKHAPNAVEAGLDLLRATGHADPSGPWLPVGVGIHTGTAFVGSVGDGTVTDFTALGDAVNITARLSSQAGPGEILISDETRVAAGVAEQGIERRRLRLKGRSEPVTVYVLKVTQAAAA